MRLSRSLVCACSLALCAVFAQAATFGDFEYQDNGSGVSVTGYTGSASTLKIPAAINGKPVTAIDTNAFRDCDFLTSVTIPDSVTTIGNYAFYGCEGLTSVTIGDSVTIIGKSAFGSCNALTSVTIPDGVTSIGDLAFAWCDTLASIEIGSGATDIDFSAFSGCGKIVVSANNPAFKSDECGAVYSKDGTILCRVPSSVTAFSIPNNVTTIGNSAFAGCYDLTSVTLPADLTTIYDAAFVRCSALTSITIPNGVTTIGDGAFYNCVTLTSVTIGDSVTSIGNDAFGWCYALTSVTIPDSVTSIGNDAFGWCYALTSVTIPDSLTAVGTGAFDRCWALEEVVFTGKPPAYETPSGWDGLTWKYPAAEREAWEEAIASGRFGAGSVTFEAYGEEQSPEPEDLWRYRVNADGSVTLLGAASGVELSGEVSLPGTLEGRKVTAIGEDAFAWCKNLVSITIPDGVTTIGTNAFFNCSALASITLPDSVTDIGISAFDGCAVLASVTIPDGVTTINAYTFQHCATLTSITIPDSVTTIGTNAFASCDGLTAVAIGDSVTTIGNYAFGWCYALTSVTIPDSVTTIGDCAFYGCKSLSSVTFGDGVTTIGIEAFSRCTNLTTVTIPDSVTAIGTGAFDRCSALREIVFTGKPPTYRTPSGWDGLTWKYPAAEREAWQEAIASGRFDGRGIVFEEYGVAPEPVPGLVFDETVPETEREWLREALESRGLSGTVTVAGDAGALAVFRTLGVLPRVDRHGATISLDVGEGAAFGALREAVASGEIIGKGQLAAKLNEKVKEMALTAPMIEVGPDGVTVEIGFQTAETLGEWKPAALTGDAVTVETSVEGTLRVRIAKPQDSNAAFYKFVVRDGLQEARRAD